MITDLQAKLHNNSMRLESVADTEFVQLRDPFTGEDFEAHRPPQSIEMQPHLRAGLDYLRSHPEVHLTILADNHGKDDIINRDEIAKILSEADSVYLEGFGATQDDADKLWEVAANNARAKDVGGLGVYKQQQYELLEGVNKPVLLPEVPSDGSEYDSNLLEFTTILDELRPLALGNENIQLAIEINLAASSIMREWYLLAKMGSYLFSLEEAGLKCEHPLLWIGSSHATTMVPKLNGLGIDFEVIEPKRLQNETSPDLLHEGDSLISYEQAATSGLSKVTRS